MALTAPLFFPGDPQAIAGPALLRPFGLVAAARHRPARPRRARRASSTAPVPPCRSGSRRQPQPLPWRLVGTLAGFPGGLVDEVLMRITDAFQTVPSFLLALALVSVVGPSLGVIVAGDRARAGPGRRVLASRSAVDPRARFCRRRPCRRHASAGDRLSRSAAQRIAAGVALSSVIVAQRSSPKRPSRFSASATPTA